MGVGEWGGKATGFRWEGELIRGKLKSSVVSGGKCWSHQLCPGDGVGGQVPVSFSVCGCVWSAFLNQGLAAERFRNNHVTQHSAQPSPLPPCRIRPGAGRQIFHLWTTDCERLKIPPRPLAVPASLPRQSRTPTLGGSKAPVHQRPPTASWLSSDAELKKRSDTADFPFRERATHAKLSVLKGAMAITEMSSG